MLYVAFLFNKPTTCSGQLPKLVFGSRIIGIYRDEDSTKSRWICTAHVSIHLSRKAGEWGLVLRQRASVQQIWICAKLTASKNAHWLTKAQKKSSQIALTIPSIPRSVGSSVNVSWSTGNLFTVQKSTSSLLIVCLIRCRIHLATHPFSQQTPTCPEVLSPPRGTFFPKRALRLPNRNKHLHRSL